MPAKTRSSRTAYREHIEEGRATSQLERVLACLRESAVPITARQIAAITGVPITAVTGRIWEVKEDPECPGQTRPTILGKRSTALVRIAYTARDPGTGRPADFLELITPAPHQRLLFHFPETPRHDAA